jgi:alpha,alpha-trehalase
VRSWLRVPFAYRAAGMAMSPPADFTPHVLRDYSLIADGERGALIGPRGDVSWMCAPAWDSDAVFSALIGGGGGYAVTPAGVRYTWGGYYEDRSLIWNSRWVTTDGIVESREALALPADADTALILRRIRVLEGSARIRVVLDVRAGFGTESMRRIHRDDDGTWTGRSGPVRFRWSGAGGARRGRSGPLVVEVELGAGETHDLVLEIGGGALPGDRPSPDTLWRATEAAWSDCVPAVAHGALGRRDAEHAMAVLTGMTASGGGLAAAATMSLPERSRAGRNYDYRYA